MNKVNNEIREHVVRVVGLQEKGFVEMSLTDAIALAEETNEDVIQISYSDGIPIVKIESYDKFAYREKKKKKEQAKKQRASNMALKEIRMLYSIEENDIKVKVKNIDRLLNSGDKVKVSIIYKGRSIKMIKGGLNKMQTLESSITAEHKIESPSRIDGNRVVMIVSPNK